MSGWKPTPVMFRLSTPLPVYVPVTSQSPANVGVAVGVLVGVGDGVSVGVGEGVTVGNGVSGRSVTRIVAVSVRDSVVEPRSTVSVYVTLMPFCTATNPPGVTFRAITCVVGEPADRERAAKLVADKLEPAGVRDGAVGVVRPAHRHVAGRH